MGKGFGLSGGSDIEIKDGPLMGAYKALAIEKVCRFHYLHSVPSVKTYWYGFRGVVCFSIPPNKEIGKFLLGKENKENAVWELSRLWGPGWARKESPNYGDKPRRFDVSGTGNLIAWLSYPMPTRMLAMRVSSTRPPHGFIVEGRRIGGGTFAFPTGYPARKNRFGVMRKGAC